MSVNVPISEIASISGGYLDKKGNLNIRPNEIITLILKNGKQKTIRFKSIK
jgi:hypothetical protein